MEREVSRDPHSIPSGGIRAGKNEAAVLSPETGLQKAITRCFKKLKPSTTVAFLPLLQTRMSVSACAHTYVTPAKQPWNSTGDSAKCCIPCDLVLISSRTGSPTFLGFLRGINKAPLRALAPVYYQKPFLRSRKHWPYGLHLLRVTHAPGSQNPHFPQDGPAAGAHSLCRPHQREVPGR